MIHIYNICIQIYIFIYIYIYLYIYIYTYIMLYLCLAQEIFPETDYKYELRLNGPTLIALHERLVVQLSPYFQRWCILK